MKILRPVITVIAFLCIPVMWLVSFREESIKEIYESWNEYRLSGKPWEGFDE